MSVCQDLVNAVNAVVLGGKKFYTDAAPNCAVLSNPSDGTPTLVQLSAGGTAILAAPVSPNLSGVPLKLTVAGNIVCSGSPLPDGIYGFLRLGSDLSGVLLWDFSEDYPSHASYSFLLSAFCLWDSGSQRFYIRSLFGGSGEPFGNEVSLSAKTVSAQSGIQFCLDFQINNPNGSRSVTITQFSLEA